MHLKYLILQTYSGYYKHEVEKNLIGAELMFELMGYKHTGLGVLTLEGPIDPDKVSNVSRDAIVAFVECQVKEKKIQYAKKFLFENVCTGYVDTGILNLKKIN